MHTTTVLLCLCGGHLHLHLHALLATLSEDTLFLLGEEVYSKRTEQHRIHQRAVQYWEGTSFCRIGWYMVVGFMYAAQGSTATPHHVHV